MEPFSVRLREAIAGSGTPFAVSIRESGKGNICHTVLVPEPFYKIHPLEMPVGTLGLAVKKGVDAGKCPKSDGTKLLIVQAVDSLNAVYDALYILRGEMLRLASLLPEFDIVMAMQGAGEVTGPQLMAEIGDVRRFTHKGALVAFAGMDAPPFQSGTFDSKSRRISKRGSPHLRKTLFMVASTILQHSDPDNPIFQFMDKKRAEGKHFYVYMVAGAAKFLRVYYARVMAHLALLDAEANTAA